MIINKIKGALLSFRDKIKPRDFNDKGYDKNGYDKYWFNKNGIHKNGKKLDYKGFKANGFNYIKKHRNGTNYDDDGFTEIGYDKDGYNRDGYNENGFHKKTSLHINGTKYDDLGFDKNGYNRDGYSIDGFNQKGYDKDGFNRKGLDYNGYNKKGKSFNDCWWRTSKTHLLKKGYFDKFIELEEKFDPKYKSNNGFINNSFNVLGLKTSSTVSDITRRGTEIKKLLAINHNPDYKYDILHTLVARDEMTVKNSIQALQQIDKRVIQSFLWFQLESKIDEEAFEFLNVDKFYSGIYTWYKDYKFKKNNNSLKNLVIAETIVFALTGSSDMQNDVINDWYTLLKDEKTWTSYKKHFLKYDLFGVDANFFEGIESKIKTNLADYFFEISMLHDNHEINKDFYNIFGFYSQKFKQEIILPILTSMSDISKSFKKTEFWFKQGTDKGTKILKNEIYNEISDYLKEIDDKQSTLKKYNLITDTDAVKVLDNLANDLRNSAIYVLNNTYSSKDDDLGRKLLSFASKVASSEMVKSRIIKDEENIRKNDETEELMRGITENIKNENYIVALESLNDLVKINDSPDVWKFYNEAWDYCVFFKAWKDFNEAMKHLESVLKNKFSYPNTKTNAIFTVQARIDILLALDVSSKQRMDLIKTRDQLDNFLYRIF